MPSKELLKRILTESLGVIPETKPRELVLPLDLEKVVTLCGPRRCGKTFLFFETMKILLNNGIPRERILYINFEDERILPFEKDDFEKLLDSFYELFPDSADKTLFLFFDEIQEIPLWEKFIRRLSEQKRHRIFITGSSAKLLSREIASALHGRTLTFHLRPFSFYEFIGSKGVSVKKNAEYSSRRHKLLAFFKTYVEWGGFPESFNLQEQFRIQLLQEYFERIFYRDIVVRYQIRNLALMKDLMRYCISQFSTLFSATKLYNYLKSSGRAIGKETIFEFLSILEEIHFVYFVPLHTYSPRQRMVNPRKMYCCDSGLVSAVAWQFSQNAGRYLEQFVFLHLLRKGGEIFYYKDEKGREIDFLEINHHKQVSLYQVSYDIGDPVVLNREIQVLADAAKKFKLKEVFLITLDEKKTVSVNGIAVTIVPAWSWSLAR